MAGKTENAETSQDKKGFFLVRWFRRLYEWVMHWADTPYAAPMLGVLSFAESSFFPIPPDVLLIPMCASRPDRAIRFGFITFVTSVLGGMLGYLIGWALFDSIGIPIIEFYGFMDKYVIFRQWFEEYNFAIIMVAGMTPLPYKVFTISAGVAAVNFPVFVAGSIFSRGLRFMAEAVVIKYGDKYTKKYLNMSTREFMDKYIEWFMILMAVLGVLGFLVVKLVLPGDQVDVKKEVELAGGGGKMEVRLMSAKSEEVKDAFDYRISIALDGSTSSASLSEKPLASPSLGKAEVWGLILDDKTTVVASSIYGDVPEPEIGTDGTIFFHAIEGGKLKFLNILGFKQYRLDKTGAYDNASLSIDTEDRTGDGIKEIIVKIEETHNPSAKGGEVTADVFEYHYRMVGGTLIKIGEQKTKKKLE